MTLADARKNAERSAIEDAVTRHGSLRAAAKELGIGYSTIKAKIAGFGLRVIRTTVLDVKSDAG